MSDIGVYTSNKKIGATLADYQRILEYYINKVLKKLRINDKNVTWYICEEKDFYEIDNNLIVSRVLLNLEKIAGISRYPKYGCTVFKKGSSHADIYISKEAILTAPAPEWNRINEIMHIKMFREELLVSVILDELAHAKTHKDHGDKAYEEKLRKYTDLYYDRNT